MIIASELKAAKEAENALMREIGRHGYNQEAMFAIRLAAEEALVNAVRHGNGFDPDKQVHIEYQVDPHKVVLTVTDQGAGFDLAAIPDPTLDENLEKPSGRGIMLMRAYMDEVEYSKCGARVRMVKCNKPDGL